jgi:hypothetical protein
MKEFDDIKEVFIPIADICTGAVTSIAIKLYGTDDKGEIIKDAFVFI